MTIADRRAFVFANTRLQSPPRVPELRLHLADEITPLWQLTERAMEALELPPPFWAFAWAGGQGLARYLLDHPEEVRGKRVLDFATGSGMVAIAAMKAGAAEALSADIERFCETAVALNAEANGVAVGFTCDYLLSQPAPPFDVILAGDISYEGPTAARVRGWLEAAAANGARVLMGDPDRSYFSRSGLKRLGMYDVPTTRELEDREVKRASVWTFDPRA